MPNQPFNYIITLSNNLDQPVNITSISDNLPSNFNLTMTSLKIGSNNPVTLLATDYTLSLNNVLNVTRIDGQSIVIPTDEVAVLSLTGYFD